MIISVRKWGARLRFLLWLAALSVLAYAMYSRVARWIEPPERYRAPRGEAVKVFSPADAADSESFWDRLRFFYWYGE